MERMLPLPSGRRVASVLSFEGCLNSLPLMASGVYSLKSALRGKADMLQGRWHVGF
jgi:hypothetical protein